MAGIPEEQLREKLCDSLEAEIVRKVAEFGGLLSRSAAVRLLCKQHGIDTTQAILLSQSTSSLLPFSFKARVNRIFPIQVFQGGDRSVRLHLEDDSGQGTLVLWNEQADLTDGKISIGDIVECNGAYFRAGEIYLSRGGGLKKSVPFPCTPIGKLEDGICNVEGTVSEVEEDRHYIDKKNGEEKTFWSFQLGGDGQCVRVVVWSIEQLLEKPPKGARLLLENVVFKNNELHFNYLSRAVALRAAGGREGKIGKVELGNGEARLEIDGNIFVLSEQTALALFGIKQVPQGVQPSTVLAIKASEMRGKTAKYREEKGVLVSLQPLG